MKSNAKVNIVVLIFILFASIFFLLNRVIWQNLYLFSNSDLLYLPSFVRDFWEGIYNWRLWVLTPAPYFFPDMVFFFLMSFFTCNLFLSFFFYSIAFALLLIYSISSVFRITEEYFSFARIAKAVTLSFALWVALISRYPEDIALFLLPSYHASSILFALLLYSLLFKTNTRRGILLFVIVSTLAIISDKQIIYTFYLPFLLASFTLRTSTMEKYYLKTIIYFVLSFLFATFILNLLSVIEIFQIPSIPVWTELKKNIFQMKGIENINKIFPEVVQFFQDFYTDKLIFFLLFLISIGLNLYYSFQFSKAKFGIRLFSRFVLFLYFFSLFSQMFFGVWGGFRYVWGLYLFPYLSVLFYTGNLLSKMLIDRNFSRVGAIRRYLFILSRNNTRSQVFFFTTVSIFVGLIVILYFINGTSKITINNPYPPFVSCLDGLQKKYNLHYGLSDYWNAKHIRYLAHDSLIVNQVFTNLEKYDWIHNRDWYTKDKHGNPITYNFIILERLDQEIIAKRFGIPTIREECEGKKILIYEKGFSY